MLAVERSLSLIQKFPILLAILPYTLIRHSIFNIRHSIFPIPAMPHMLPMPLFPIPDSRCTLYPARPPSPPLLHIDIAIIISP